MLKRIYHDVYDISSRIRQVDPRYEVFFNDKNGNFELFFKRGSKKEFCICLGKRLDARAIKLALTTQAKNSKEIFKSIFENNAKIDRDNNRYLKEFSCDNLSAFLDYADKKGGDIDFSNVNQFMWI